MIRLAAIYFATIFGAGFVLGILRVMFLVPTMGRRYAELLEIPIMLAVIYIAGSRIAKQTQSQKQALAVGFVALSMLLGAEIGLAAILFGKGPLESLLDKDPVSGGAYYVSLVIFAFMPSWVRHLG